MRRQRRNLIWVSTGLVISILLAIAAVVSGIFALRQSQRALASHLAAQATNLVNSQPDLSLLLSLEANYIGDQMKEEDPALIGSLVTTLNSSPKLDTFLRAHDGDVRAVAFSPDGRRLAAGAYGHAAVVWEAETGKELFTLHGNASVTAVTFSPDGGRLVSASSGGTVQVWEMASGQEILTLRGGTTSLCSMAYSPDGRRLASWGMDFNVRLYDVATGRETKRLTGHSGRVFNLHFHKDGRYLVSAGADRTLLAVLVNGYREEEVPGESEGRTVLRLDPSLAPVKAGGLDREIQVVVDPGRMDRAVPHLA